MKRASPLAGQLGFTFDPPAPAREPAALAGRDARYAAAVALALKDDRRSREEIAGAMTALLDQDVTRFMLDAYASPAREGHCISAARFDALVAATNRFDLMAALDRDIGVTVLIGEEALTARLGHLQARRTEIDAEIRALRTRAQPIEREARTR